MQWLAFSAVILLCLETLLQSKASYLKGGLHDYIERAVRKDHLRTSSWGSRNGFLLFTEEGGV
jgi:hypothetical protein